MGALQKEQFPDRSPEAFGVHLRFVFTPSARFRHLELRPDKPIKRSIVQLQVPLGGVEE